MAPFSSYSEHFEIWAKFCPLVQILITPSHWKDFGPTKSYDHQIFFQVISKSFRQSPEHFDMSCTATSYVLQPLLVGCCWPTALSVLGRMPTFPLRIKSLFQTLWHQHNQLSNGYKNLPATSCHKPRKPSILKTNHTRLKNDANKSLLFFKQTVASCTLSKHMVFSKSTSMSINTID